MIHSMEYWKDGTAHGKFDGFIDVMLLVQYYVTVMGSDVIVVSGE